MNSAFLILFLLMLIVLVVAFTLNSSSKKTATEAEQPNEITVSPWMAPALLQSLRDAELISATEAESLEGKAFEELESYVIDHNIFESHEELKEWILQQQDLVGNGDSVFGGIDRFR